MSDGLMLSFLTFFHGTVDPFHLAHPLIGDSWRRNYSEGQKLKVSRSWAMQTHATFRMHERKIEPRI